MRRRASSHSSCGRKLMFHFHSCRVAEEVEADRRAGRVSPQPGEDALEVLPISAGAAVDEIWSEPTTPCLDSD